MNIPVVLFFHHPQYKKVFWKSVQDYLRSEPNLLKRQTKYVIVAFDKERDIFSVKTLASLSLVVEGKYDYEKIIYVGEETERISSNWFPVKQFPTIIYKAPTKFTKREEIIKNLHAYYAFILKEKAIWSFSNLENDSCELSEYCETIKGAKLKFEEIDEIYRQELLKQVLSICAAWNQLVPEGDRFYFSYNVLKKRSDNIFGFWSLKGRWEHRKKIYIRKKGNITEYQHHAVKLKFFQIAKDWFLEIELDWYFTYHPIGKIRRDIGIRITREKANMYNMNYHYLLHFWKQFLSKNSDSIILHCDSTPNPQKIIVDTNSLSVTAPFTLLNDYVGPRGFSQRGEK